MCQQDCGIDWYQVSTITHQNLSLGKYWKQSQAILNRVLLQEWRQEKKKISGESLKTVFLNNNQVYNQNIKKKKQWRQQCHENILNGIISSLYIFFGNKNHIRHASHISRLYSNSQYGNEDDDDYLTKRCNSQFLA